MPPIVKIVYMLMYLIHVQILFLKSKINISLPRDHSIKPVTKRSKYMYFIHNEEKILQILRNRYDDIFHQINYIPIF